MCGSDRALARRRPISEFAGAHVELKHALTVNPYSPGSMDEALRTALAMPDPERRLRMRRMDRIVRTHSARRWASDFLALLEPDPARALGPSCKRLRPGQPALDVERHRIHREDP
jgi:trehalose-6-phosphate synthase